MEQHTVSFLGEMSQETQLFQSIASENADNMQQQCHLNAVARMLHIAVLRIS